MLYLQLNNVCSFDENDIRIILRRNEIRIVSYVIFRERIITDRLNNKSKFCIYKSNHNEFINANSNFIYLFAVKTPVFLLQPYLIISSEMRNHI